MYLYIQFVIEFVGIFKLSLNKSRALIEGAQLQPRKSFNTCSLALQKQFDLFATPPPTARPSCRKLSLNVAAIPGHRQQLPPACCFFRFVVDSAIEIEIEIGGYRECRMRE